MASKKPLPKEKNGVRIISDCGVGKLHKNSGSTTRNAIVECAECKAHRKVNVYSLSKLCPSCSNKGSGNGSYKHGLNRKSRAHNIWTGMKSRCNSATNKDYKYYGGRGIEVCEDWTNFNEFNLWCAGRLDKEASSIERVEVNGNYEPSNCIIIPTYLQSYGRRNGIGLHKAVEFARDLVENGRGDRGYVMRFMNKYDLRDYQVKQFVLYNKHLNELAELKLCGI